MSLTPTMAGAETCPVCGASDGRPIYPEAQDPITLDSFRVPKWSSCGVAYTIPRPSSLDKFYPKRYREYGSLVTRVLSALYGIRVSRWARLKPAGGSVLEVGCGPGLMLAALHQRAGACSESSATKRWRSRLAPGGRLIANAPNFSSGQSRFTGSKWLHLYVPRHLVHFTPQTLMATLERAGLKVSAMSFASFEHDPYGWAESTINRLTGCTGSTLAAGVSGKLASEARCLNGSNFYSLDPCQKITPPLRSQVLEGEYMNDGRWNGRAGFLFQIRVWPLSGARTPRI